MPQDFFDQFRKSPQAAPAPTAKPAGDFFDTYRQPATATPSAAQPAEQPSAWSRFIGPQAANWNPLNLLQPLLHPLDTLDAVGQQMTDLGNRANRETGMEAAVHKAASYFPVFGPAAIAAGDQWQSGDHAGAVGSVLGVGEGMLMGSKLPAAVSGAIKSVPKVGGVLNAAAQGASLGPGGLFNEAVLGTTRALPKGLMNRALKATLPMKQEFPGMAERLIEDRTLPTPNDIQGALTGLEKNKDTLLHRYAGTHIDDIDLLNDTLPSAEAYVKDRSGMDNLQVGRADAQNTLTDLTDTYIDENRRPLSVVDANNVKIAEGNRAKFNPQGETEPITGLFREGVALANRDNIASRVPGYQDILDQQQPYIGALEAAKRTDLAPHELHRLAELGALTFDPVAGAKLFAVNEFSRNPYVLGHSAFAIDWFGNTMQQAPSMGEALQKAILLGSQFNPN